MSSSKEKIAFVHVPKTAGGSIKFWLRKNELEVYISDPLGDGHLMLNEIEDHYGAMDWSFVCVRNSYERMISFYEYSKKKYNDRKLQFLYRSDSSLEDFEKEILIEANEKISYIDKGIVFFMEKSKLENHRAMISQLEFTKGVHYILRSEDFEKNFTTVKDRLKCDLRIGKTHRVLDYNDRKHYKDRTFIDAVREYFKDEIETFDYGIKHKNDFL